MNKSPTMLAVSRQYVWIKLAKYIYKLFLVCWTHCYSFPGSSDVREIECGREIRKLPNLKESTLGKIARKERGIFVEFVFCIFEEVNFICTATQWSNQS